MNEAASTCLERRCALITGAAKRIGAAIAERLHAEGASVAIHYRSSGEEANALAEHLNARRKGSAATFRADLNDGGAPQALIDEVLAWSDQLDVLVNNASSFYPTPLGKVGESDWDDLVGSNLKAPLFLSQAAAPSLKKAGGCIINIVDIHARRPLRDHVVYGPAKAGLVMLTRSLAKDLAPQVRVNGIAPGAIAWPENGMSEETRRNILRQVPLGRTGSPEDIAAAARFLICDGTYVTGHILVVDGGRSIGW